MAPKTDVIEQLRERVRELEEENARLHEQVDLQIPAIAFKQLTEQLAASQAYAEQLREALETLNKVSNIGCDRVEKALALPRDTSALDAYVANQREAAYQEARKAADQFEKGLTQQRDNLLAQVDLAVKALHHISLCSQNSMSSQRQCGELARAAIKESEEN